MPPFFIRYIDTVDHSVVSRLTKTWALLSKKDKQQFDRLAELFGEKDNWTALRDYLRSISLPCIPYLGKFCKSSSVWGAKRIRQDVIVLRCAHSLRAASRARMTQNFWHILLWKAGQRGRLGQTLPSLKGDRAPEVRWHDSRSHFDKKACKMTPWLTFFQFFIPFLTPCICALCQSLYLVSDWQIIWLADPFVMVTNSSPAQLYCLSDTYCTFFVAIQIRKTINHKLLLNKTSR